jgi:CxxC motif-containing protein (DUF1111 family)
MTSLKRPAVAVLATLLLACSPPTGEQAARMDEVDPLAPGGTHRTLDIDPAAAWPPATLIDHAPADDRGRRLFYRNWLTTLSDGHPLAGPGLDDASCAGCHIEMARPGDRTLDYDPLLIARPVDAGHRSEFGPQIHRFRVDGRAPAATLHIEWVSIPFVYPDGSRQQLRYPVARASAEGETIPVALRAAPLLFGWGLLERADPDMLAHFDDPQDRDDDGISGRMARIDRGDERGAIGLLGWKLEHARLREQIRTALAHDIGVTSRACGEPTTDSASAAACRPEISEADLDALTDYVAGIGVPDRRDGASLRGQDLFGQAGCAQCHVPVLQTLPSERPALDRQWLWAYTDLMLHDMGPDLADPGDAPEAREWRTAPLWGVGLAERWLPDRGFLHDGRARTLEEAILWHGGEARPSRDAFAALSAADRAALLAFVRAL